MMSSPDPDPINAGNLISPDRNGRLGDTYAEDVGSAVQEGHASAIASSGVSAYTR